MDAQEVLWSFDKHLDKRQIARIGESVSVRTARLPLLGDVLGGLGRHPLEIRLPRTEIGSKREGYGGENEKRRQTLLAIHRRG